jgi:hypothetical protein
VANDPELVAYWFDLLRVMEAWNEACLRSIVFELEILLLEAGFLFELFPL